MSTRRPRPSNQRGLREQVLARVRNRELRPSTPRQTQLFPELSGLMNDLNDVYPDDTGDGGDTGSPSEQVPHVRQAVNESHESGERERSSAPHWWNEEERASFLDTLSTENNLTEWSNNMSEWSSMSLADRNRHRRELLIEVLRAYTPGPPVVPGVQELAPPCPLAVSDEHEMVCSAIDVCDEYEGELDVTPDQEFLCPVSHLAIRDPVSAPDGYVYEKSYVETSQRASKMRCVPWSSPMTRLPWNETTIFPRSVATVTSMRLWVKLKAIEVAGAKFDDGVCACAKKLVGALGVGVVGVV